MPHFTYSAMLIFVKCELSSLIYLGITASTLLLLIYTQVKTINSYSVLGYSIQIVPKYTSFTYSVMLIFVNVNYFNHRLLKWYSFKPALFSQPELFPSAHISLGWCWQVWNSWGQYFSLLILALVDVDRPEILENQINKIFMSHPRMPHEVVLIKIFWFLLSLVHFRNSSIPW